MIDRQTQRAQVVAVACVVLALAITLVMALLDSKPRRSGTNSIPATDKVATITKGQPLCLGVLSIPPETSGIRVHAGHLSSSPATVELTLSDPRQRIIGRGRARPSASAGPVLIRFPELRSGSESVHACLTTSGVPTTLYGVNNNNADRATELSLGTRPVLGEIAIDYIRPGSESLLTMVPKIFERASLFRPGWVGPWTFYLLALIALISIAAAAWVLIGLGRGRRINWVLCVALFAFVNAAVWATLTPAFNVPDEFAHFTFVETLAHGELPDRAIGPGETGNSYLPSSVLASNFTATGVVLGAHAKPTWRKRDEAAFTRAYDKLKNSDDDVMYGLTPAKAYSPVYYAGALVPYAVAADSGVFGKLWSVRIYSALLAALAAALCLLFARELAPRVEWFAPVAGMAVAFEPMIAHIGGGVNNDNLVITLCAAVMYLLTRAIRRGLNIPLAVGIGAAFAIGVTAKPQVLGLAPALLLAGWVLMRRSGSARRETAVALAASAVTTVAIVGIGLALFGLGSADATVLASSSGGSRGGSLGGLLSFLWQWYLPALPFMPEFVDGAPPVGAVFIRGFTGMFNHLETAFPNWVYVMVTIGGAALFVSATRYLHGRRDALKRSWPLVGVPLAGFVGLAMFVNLIGYLVLIRDNTPFAQGRYLLPAIAVFGVYVATGALGFGRRYGLAVGTTVVLSLASLNLVGMGLSLARFYT